MVTPSRETLRRFRAGLGLLAVTALGVTPAAPTLSHWVRPTRFDIRAFGALGDGRADDTLAVRSALGAARASGGGTVYFPPGTYIIDPASGPFIVGSDVAFVGAGPQSILRVRDNAGRYNLIFGQMPQRIHDVAFRHLRIDQNPAGNKISDINPLTDAENVVQLYDFSGVTVDDVAFWPEPGIQAIVLAGPHASDALVQRCLFAFQRGHTSNPFYDNSSVYTEAAGVRIHDNRFVSTNVQNAVTAIEVHGGPNIEAARNETSQFQVGFNVVNSTARYPNVRAAHVAIHDNRLLETTQAFALWSVTGRTLRDVRIEHNLITMAQHLQYRNTWLGAYFVRGPRAEGIDGDFASIELAGNTFDFRRLAEQRIAPLDSVGIDVEPKGALRGLVATDNTVLGSPLTGLRIGGSTESGRLEDVLFEGNRIEDAGWKVHVPKVARSAVTLERARLTRVHVDRNLVLDTGRFGSLRDAFSAWAHPLPASRDVTLRYDRIAPRGVMRYSVDRHVVDDRGTRP